MKQAALNIIIYGIDCPSISYFFTVPSLTYFLLYQVQDSCNSLPLFMQSFSNYLLLNERIMVITPIILLDVHTATTAAKPKPTIAIRSSDLSHCFREIQIREIHKDTHTHTQIHMCEYIQMKNNPKIH